MNANAAISNLDNAVAVFTSRSRDEILETGGTGNWGVSKDRILQNRYVVMVRNRHSDWTTKDVPHSTAFLIGRISGVTDSGEMTNDGRPRYIINFDAFADVNVPDTWSGSRNPVWFTNLRELGINADELDFHSITDGAPAEATNAEVRGMTFMEARHALAARYGVAPNRVEIVIRG